MKKTVLLILMASDAKKDLRELREEAIKYVGLRTVPEDNTEENAPAILLNDILREQDKEEMAKLFGQWGVGLAFIEAEESVIENHDLSYFNLALKP